MGATPKYAFPLPELDDPPDAVAQLAAMANAIESEVQAPDLLTWTPTWTSAGSLQPTNPASLTGHYMQKRGYVDFTVRLALGSTSTGGSGQWYLSLPIASRAGDMAQHLCIGRLYEPQVGNFIAMGIILANTSRIQCHGPYGGTSNRLVPIQHRNVTNTAGTHLPIHNPGPVQSGTLVVYSGRYRHV